MLKALLIPTYLPSISAAAVMAQAEKVVMEIHDNYQKQSYRNRTYINTANGALTLTIPIKHNITDGHKKTSEALIENNFLWQRQHWRSIQISYRSSPFFEFYEDDLKVLFEENYQNLMQFNIIGTKLLMELIGISPEIGTSSSYEKETNFPDYRHLSLAKSSNSSFVIPKYNQVFEDKNPFNPQVSVLDLLFNKGPEAASFLKGIEF